MIAESGGWIWWLHSDKTGPRKKYNPMSQVSRSSIRVGQLEPVTWQLVCRRTHLLRDSRIVHDCITRRRLPAQSPYITSGSLLGCIVAQAARCCRHHTAVFIDKKNAAARWPSYYSYSSFYLNQATRPTCFNIPVYLFNAEVFFRIFYIFYHFIILAYAIVCCIWFYFFITICHAAIVWNKPMMMMILNIKNYYKHRFTRLAEAASILITKAKFKNVKNALS